MAELLSLDGVTAGYGASVVLEEISLALDDGDSLALLGRNGVGKSTLLVTLMGLTRLHRGALRWRGSDLTALPTYQRAQAGIGWVPQERYMWPSLTIEEHLTAVARPGRWTLRRIYDLFPRLEERRSNLGNQLSGGEQQMLAIARALVVNPRLLLLDEPSLGLAPAMINELFEALADLRDEGTTILLVDQMARLALTIADRGYVLESGRIVRADSAAALTDDPVLEAAYLGRAKAAR